MIVRVYLSSVGTRLLYCMRGFGAISHLQPSHCCILLLCMTWLTPLRSELTLCIHSPDSVRDIARVTSVTCLRYIGIDIEPLDFLSHKNESASYWTCSFSNRPSHIET